MKNIFLLLVVFISVQSFGQTKKYGERLNTDGTIDSFYIKTPVSHDSVFNYSGDGFTVFTLDYYVRNNLITPIAFRNFVLCGDGVYRNNIPRADFAFQGLDYAVDAGSTDDYVVTYTRIPAAYRTGMRLIFKANTQNTTGATINVNGLGVKNILKRVNTTLATGDILAGMLCEIVYDGTAFILINPVVN